MNWEWVVVGVAVAAAAYWLARRLRATVKGQAGCQCASAKTCGGVCPAATMLSEKAGANKTEDASPATGKTLSPNKGRGDKSFG